MQPLIFAYSLFPHALVKRRLIAPDLTTSTNPMDEGGGAPPDPLTSGRRTSGPGFSQDGGAFLLQLLQKPPQSSLLPTQPTNHHYPINPRHGDPAVAAVGPSLPFNLSPPVDPTHILSSSPTVPFPSLPHVIFNHANNNQQFLGPQSYQPMQGFDYSTVGRNWGANQGYPIGINGDMAHDAFQRNNQQFMPPLNQSFGLSTTGRDMGTNQGYPIGINGVPREENRNQNPYDAFHNNSQQFGSPLNHHQRLDFPTMMHDFGVNHGNPSGNNGSMRDEKRNQRVVHDASGVLDKVLQREWEERRQQRPVHASSLHPPSVHQFPPSVHHQGFDSHGNGIAPLEREERRKDKYNPHSAVCSLSEEETVNKQMFQIANKKIELGFLGSNSSEISFMASSSENCKDVGGEDLSEQLVASLVVSEDGDIKNSAVEIKKSSRNKVK